ncbi:hypothetical protein [Bacillus sp. FJAT-27445]|uniref:hypothetical protein n=1 Tax=Bacillus sp. FJAT-27445 TaxID=1679166 RepID=UPI000743702F|nr:hypothetical protein [Bacillus sp. FJAT-27445]
MNAIERRFIISNKIRNFLTVLFVGYIVFWLILSVMKFPMSVAGLFFKVDPPAYLPIEADQKYARVIGMNRVQLIYENQNESIVVWATSKLGWNNVSDWDETLSMPDGTRAYYTLGANDTQMFSWKRGKVEYTIDYKGTKDLGKEEFIKTALSMK